MSATACPATFLAVDQLKALDAELVVIENLEALASTAPESTIRHWARETAEKRRSGGHMAGLESYWKEHLGGKKGDFMECVTTLMNSRSHFSEDSAKRLCNYWHRHVLGVAPGKEQA